MLTQLPDSDIVAEFPATPAQRRFWFLHQLDPRSVANNLSVQWELHGACPDDVIEDAFRTIAERHEILRTRLTERDGDVLQQVSGHSGFRLSKIDLRHLAPDDHRARIDDIAAQMSAEPFDLGNTGLFRVVLARSAPDWCSLLIAAHHAVFDGYSIRVLGEEFGEIVAARLEDRPADLPNLPLQYGDYALWQEACEASEAFSDSRSYWLRQMAAAPRCDLPQDRSDISEGTRRAARLNIPLEPDFGDSLTAAALRHRTSAFVLGSTIMGVALQRLTGQRDVLFGSTFAGRTEAELEDLIGVFINPIVLRLNLDETRPISAAIAETTETAREALSHGDYPFDRLVGDLNLPRVPDQTPLVSTLFSLANVFLQEKSYGPVSLVSVASQTPDITHDLSVNIIGRGSGWLMMVDYDAARFSEAAIRRFTDLMRAGFRAIFAGAGMPLAEIGVPTGARPSPTSHADHLPAATPETAGAETTGSTTIDRLRALWSEVLGLPASACEGDFFALGGHSLLALRMLARTEAEFGVRPSLPRFLEGPTLAGCAAQLDALLGLSPADAATPAVPLPARIWDDDLEVIWLREGQEGAPVLVTLNQPFLYVGLSRQLASDASCLNLHVAKPEALDGDDRQTWDALVQACAGRIVRLAHGRPVLLLGQCVDGVLALDVARALDAMGQPADTVAMIDSWTPHQSSPVSAPRRLARRLWARMRRLRLDTGDLLTGRLGLTGYVARVGIGRRLLVSVGALPRATDDEQREVAVNERLQDLARTAGSETYAGAALLLATARQTARARRDRFGWGPVLAADTPVFTLPGWHEDALLRNGTGEIAAILNARLSRAARAHLARAARD